VKRGWIIAAVVIVLAVVVFVSIKKAHHTSGVPVYAQAVKKQDIIRWVKASGQVDPRVKVNISAHVIARIDKLYVHEGDEVKKGQRFLDLEKAAFVAARDRAVASLAIAHSELRQAKIDLADNALKLKRAERLSREKIISPEDLEAAQLADKTAQSRLEQAKEGVLQAQASLAQAKDDLAKTTIFAPISGRVISLSAKQGEVVVTGTMNNPASVIATIADLSEILAEVDVDENDVVYLKNGQTAELDVDALPDHPYAGRVIEIGSSGVSLPQQPDVTFFKVKVLFEHPDEQLRPGMSVRAKIKTAEHKDALVVPIQAVVQRRPKKNDKAKEASAKGKGGEKETQAAEKGSASKESTPEVKEKEIPVVFVVKDGKVHQTPVTTGISDETDVEVLSGLEEGQQVVTGPYRALKDLENGKDVTVRKAGEITMEEAGQSSSGGD